MTDPKDQTTREELCCRFQDIVSQYLIRHQSVLDIISKLQEASSRTNRAVVKSITSCGCLQVSAEKQQMPENINFNQMKEYMDNHLAGQLCEDCREVLEDEIGKTLFYLAAICDVLDLDLARIMEKELKRMSTLGIFNLR